MKISSNRTKRVTVAVALVFALVFALPFGVSGFFAQMGLDGKVTQDTFDVNAYAAAKTVKVTWNANGGKIGTKAKVATKIQKSKKLGTLKSAKRTGYTFKGWYTKKQSGTKITKNTRATKNATYYARWTASKYTLTFNANGGKIKTESKKVTFGKAYGTLPDPTRSGYQFLGWYTAKTGGKCVTPSTKTTSAKNVTIYARWAKLPTVESITVGSLQYVKNPNGSANSCYVWYDIEISDIDPNYIGGLEVKSTLTTTDYEYKDDESVNYFEHTDLRHIDRNGDGTGYVHQPVTVYCILYGGTSGTTPTTLTITAGGKSTTVALPYRAANFEGGGRFNSSPYS